MYSIFMHCQAIDSLTLTLCGSYVFYNDDYGGGFYHRNERMNGSTWCLTFMGGNADISAFYVFYDLYDWYI